VAAAKVRLTMKIILDVLHPFDASFSLLLHFAGRQMGAAAVAGSTHLKAGSPGAASWILAFAQRVNHIAGKRRALRRSTRRGIDGKQTCRGRAIPHVQCVAGGRDDG